jgi:cytidylate kinase
MAHQEEVLREILERDQRDSTRAVGPLAIPPGAVVIDTTTITEGQVIAQIVNLARDRRPTTESVAT